MTYFQKSLVVTICSLTLSACATQREPSVVYAEPVFTGKYDPPGGEACADVAGAQPCTPPPTCADGSTGNQCVPGSGGNQPGRGPTGQAAGTVS